MLLVPARVSLLSERRVKGPSGAKGGRDGAPGENVLISNGIETGLPGKTSFTIQAGDIISIRSPGGGGWGTTVNNLEHES
jgi:N-methylhydantoinase B/oxoprolinase/acetone carboxylase alpha subunit